MSQSKTLEVARDDYRKTRVVGEDLPALRSGDVLLRVDRFAITSNNITYANFGDAMKYWSFFPAEGGWGRIPAMGFADVVESANPDVAVGERFFGFYPMGTHLLVHADKTSPSGFFDANPVRAETAPAYRQYSRTTADAMYSPDSEDIVMLLRGLFMTSYLVDDFLADNAFFGAENFVISSASSKTAIALAYLLARREGAHVIGLTSPRNAGFVRSLGYFDEVVCYDDVKTIAADVPTVFIEHSGNAEVIHAVHAHLGSSLAHCCIVGGTHWEAPAREGKLPGPEPVFFFAPAQIQKRSAEWGPGEFQARLGAAWSGFREASRTWLEVSRAAGPAAVEAAYRRVLDGEARPDQGLVVSAWDDA